MSTSDRFRGPGLRELLSGENELRNFGEDNGNLEIFPKIQEAGDGIQSEVLPVGVPRSKPSPFFQEGSLRLT